MISLWIISIFTILSRGERGIYFIFCLEIFSVSLVLLFSQGVGVGFIFALVLLVSGSLTSLLLLMFFIRGVGRDYTFL